MNILQTLASIFAKPKVEDMVANFVSARLETDTARVLVSDKTMHKVYTRLATRLACSVTGERMQVVGSVDECSSETVMVHGTFNAGLLRRVAERCSHVVMIVEYFDTSALYQEQLSEIQRETGCRIDFAFMQEGCGAKTPYSPTECRYVVRMINKLVNLRLRQEFQ